MTIRRLIYFSDRAAGLLGTISSSTVNAAIEKAYGAPAPVQDEREAVERFSPTTSVPHCGRASEVEAYMTEDDDGEYMTVSQHERIVAALTRPAQTEQQPAYVECRECTDCGHVGINDAHPTDATCAMCDWSGPSPVEDQCPDCGKENAMGAACPKCSGRYRILAETHVAAPIAQTEQQPVAYVRFRNGEVDYDIDDNIVISNMPGDEDNGVTWLPVYAAPIAQTAPQPEQSGLRAGQVVAMCEVGHDRLERAALDTKRLEWMLAERCIIESQNGTGSPAVYRVAWPGLGEAQSEWYPTEREAIDNAQGSCHE